jgi:hypothetical protein
MLCFILTLSSSLFILCNAQQVQWSTQEENDFKGNFEGKPIFIGNSAYIIQSKSALYSMPKFIFEKYDLPDMKKVYATELYGTDDGTPKGKKIYITEIYGLKNDIIAIGMGLDYKKVYAFKVNLEDGTIINNKVEVGECEGKSMANMFEMPYHFTVSNDGSTLIGYAGFKKTAKIHVAAIDGNLKTIWSKDFLPPFSDKYGFLASRSQNGKSISLLSIIQNKGDEQKFKYEVVTVDNTDKASEIRLDLGSDKDIRGCNFQIDTAGIVVVAGMYHNTGKPGLTGTFGLRIDGSSGKILYKSTSPFPVEFLSKFISNRKIDKGKGIDDMGIDEIFLGSDNNIIISAERYEVISNRYGATYKYNDVIVAKLDDKCNLSWITAIPKKQASNGSNSASRGYGIAETKGTIYVAFPDNKHNIKLDPEVMETNPGKMDCTDLDDGDNCALAFVSLKMSNGEQSRKYLTQSSDVNDLVYKTKAFVKVMDNYVFVYRQSKKKQQLGLISFN